MQTKLGGESMTVELRPVDRTGLDRVAVRLAGVHGKKFGLPWQRSRKRSLRNS